MAGSKKLVFAKGLPGFTTEQVKEYWLANYAPLQRQLMAYASAILKKSVVNFVKPGVYSTKPWFDALSVVYSSDALVGNVPEELMKYRKMQWAEEEKFMDRAGAVMIDVEEVVIADKNTGKSANPLEKTLVLCRIKPGITMEQFKKYWLTRHADSDRALMAENPRIRKMVANFALPGRGGKEPMWHSIFEIYTDPGQGSPTPKFPKLQAALDQDEANFIDLPGGKIICGVEEVVIAENR